VNEELAGLLDEMEAGRWSTAFTDSHTNLKGCRKIVSELSGWSDVTCQENVITRSNSRAQKRNRSKSRSKPLSSSGGALAVSGALPNSTIAAYGVTGGKKRVSSAPR